MTRGTADHKQSKFGNCSVSLLNDSGTPSLLFSGFWTSFSPQKENFKKSCELLIGVERGMSCKVSLSDDCHWDSSFVLFLQRFENKMKLSGIKLDFSSLPLTLSNLLAHSCRNQVVEVSEKPSRDTETEIFKHISIAVESFLNISDFLGKCLIYSSRLFRGKSYLRFKDFLLCCRDCGASALPIVTLISYLTGLTMAFVGSVQLEKFNATIYTADLVCLAMVREMGPLMVAIVMAGRTGASFAAELGSMKLSEEVDSLRTLGIPAVDFLVLPRVLIPL